MSKPTFSSSFAGEAAKKYISAALLSGTTLDNGGLTIMPNVRFKSVIQKVAAANLIANSTCDFTDAGTVAVTERVLTLEEFQVNVKFCSKQFTEDWLAMEQGVSAYKNMPASFVDYIVAHFADQISASVENSIWQGSNSTGGQIDGFETLWAADNDIVDVTGTTITAANVVTELGKVVDAMPNTIYGAEDLAIYVSTEVMQNYIRSLGGHSLGLGANGFENKGQMWYNGQALTFDGIPLFLAKGLSANTMALAQKSNLFFGTGLLDDMNEIRLIDTSETLGDRNARFIARFAYGIQYGVAEEIVLYT